MKDIGQIVGGGTPSTKDVDNFGDAYPWITPKDMSRQRSRFMSAGERGISEKGLARSSARVVPAGTVLISSRAPIGLTAIAAVPVATNQGCRNFIPGPDADSLFMYYLLSSMTDEFDRHANGSTFREISGTSLGQLEVSLPPIEAQKEIGATLGALDDKIESSCRVIDLAEELGDALFAASADTAVALTDVAQLTMGSSPPGSSYNEKGVGIPFYQGIRDFGRRYPGIRVWTTAPVRLAQAEDALISVRAPVGQLNRASEMCCIGRGVASVRSDTPSTMYYALRAAGDLWEPFQQEGTVFGAINRADMAAAELPWPVNAGPLEARLSSLDEQIASASREIDYLTALRETLRPELLSGRASVSLGASE